MLYMYKEIDRPVNWVPGTPLPKEAEVKSTNLPRVPLEFQIWNPFKQLISKAHKHRLKGNRGSRY